MPLLGKDIQKRGENQWNEIRRQHFESHLVIHLLNSFKIWHFWTETQVYSPDLDNSDFNYINVRRTMLINLSDPMDQFICRWAFMIL